MSSYWVDCRRPDVLSDLTVLVTAAGALVYARPDDEGVRCRTLEQKDFLRQDPSAYRLLSDLAKVTAMFTWDAATQRYCPPAV